MVKFPGVQQLLPSMHCVTWQILGSIEITIGGIAGMRSQRQYDLERLGVRSITE